MDFIVELLPLEGCTAIFVVVERLSKIYHFLPLKKTPSAMEMEIARLNGVPTNIVSGFSSLPDSGKLYVKSLRSKDPCPPSTIPRPMGKWRGPTSSWSSISAALPFSSRMTGHHCCHWRNVPTILPATLLQVSHLSLLIMVYTPFSYLTLFQRPWFLLSKTLWFSLTAIVSCYRKRSPRHKQLTRGPLTRKEEGEN